MKELTTDDKKIQFLSSIQDRKTKINIIVQSIIDKDKIWEELRKIDDEFSIAYQLIEGTRNVDINYKSIGLPSKMTIGIEIEAEGEDMIIAFNSKYFIDALKVIDDEKVTLQFTTSLSPCIIKPVEGDEYKYLILPMRI